MKRWQFLLISCLILTAILLIHVTLEARQNEIRELEQKIGDRAMDRVLEMCEIVENRGKSYRKMIAGGEAK